MDFDDFLFFVMGVFMAMFGWYLMQSPIHTSWRFGTVDLGPYHWVVGALFFVIGIVALIYPIAKLYRDR
jgi:H+/Cl- antiporter ClcA